MGATQHGDFVIVGQDILDTLYLTVLYCTLGYVEQLPGAGLAGVAQGQTDSTR